MRQKFKKFVNFGFKFSFWEHFLLVKFKFLQKREIKTSAKVLVLSFWVFIKRWKFSNPCHFERSEKSKEIWDTLWIYGYFASLSMTRILSLRALRKQSVAIHRVEFAFKFRGLPRLPCSLAMTVEFVILNGVR